VRRLLPALLALGLAALAGAGPAAAQNGTGVDPKDVGGLYVGFAHRNNALTVVTRQSFIYGECRPREGEDAGCVFPLQLRRLSSCERNPLEDGGSPRVPARRRSLVRGAIVATYPEQDAVEVTTGTDTILIFSALQASPKRIVEALRPVAGPWRLDRDLPRPVLPTSVLRAVADVRSAHRRTGSVAATARRLRMSRAEVTDRLGLGRRLDALGRVRGTRC
jgi:hypothetical protein